VWVAGEVENSPYSPVSIHTFHLYSLYNTHAVRNYVETINKSVI